MSFKLLYIFFKSSDVSGIVSMLNRLICTLTIIIENLVWESTLVRKKS